MEYESKAMSTTELIYGHKDEQIPILEPVLKTRTLVIIYAEAGVGKTFVALKLAHCLATGARFLTWTPSKTHTVIYFDGEMGAHELSDRIVDIEKGSNTSVKPTKLRWVMAESFEGNMPNLASHSGQQVYDAEIEAAQADVVIIDNLQSCSTPIRGGESEAGMWAPVQAWAYRQKSQGRLVIIVDHANKAGEIYGSVKKRNSSDLILHLRPPMVQANEGDWDNAFELHFDKGRYLKRALKIPLWVEQTDMGEEGMRFKSSPLIDYHMSLVDRFKNATISDMANALGISIQHAAFLKASKNGAGGAFG